MCLHVLTDTKSFYIINVYCQFSLPIEPFLTKVESIINKIKSNNIIIVMDSNACSRLCFSKDTDERGRLVEELLVSKSLFSIHEPGNPPTYI